MKVEANEQRATVSKRERHKAIDQRRIEKRSGGCRRTGKWGSKVRDAGAGFAFARHSGGRGPANFGRRGIGPPGRGWKRTKKAIHLRRSVPSGRPGGPGKPADGAL